MTLRGLLFKDPNICSSERQLNNKRTVGQHRFCACASVVFGHVADDVQLYLFVYAQFVCSHASVITGSLWFMKMEQQCVLISGAVRVQTPLFLPRNRKLYDGIELACFMDHSGMLVTLPYDLRVSLTHTRSLVYVSTHAHRAPIIKLFT